MNRKHFEWAAREIAELFGDSHDRVVAEVFARRLFERFGENFDRVRFEQRIRELSRRASSP